MGNVRWTPILGRVLSAFDGASVAVLEVDYFDTDYRSEFSATHETTFAVRDPATVRALFFSGITGGTLSLRRIAQAAASGTNDDGVPASSEYPSQVSPLDEQHDGPSLSTGGAAQNRSRLLGYTVLRPQSPGTVGRSIVPPPPESTELKEPTRLGHRVRTGVSEEIELFGERLVTYGTPFMEQDGQLLRCVHAAAWMTHYTATLRGLTSRKRTAEIHEAEDDQFTLGRRYPSPGLTEESLNRVLGRIGLPAIFFDYNALKRKRPPRWHDRAEVWRRQEDLSFWITENLTEMVCRYLNSGLPVILARNDSQHALVVCGYVRAEDLADSTDDSDPSRVAKFIVHDDQIGPYDVVDVREIGSALTDNPSSIGVLAPVPPGLWLSGSDAELLGAEVFEAAVAERLNLCDAWCAHHGIASEYDDRRAVLEDLRVRLDAGTRGADQSGPTARDSLAIRSAALTGSDFKRSFIKLVSYTKGADLVADAGDIAGLVKLPKYVWVIEVFDRNRRDGTDDAPAVVGTVVIDASAGIKRESELKAVHTLLVHLGGQVSITPHSEDPKDWIPVRSTPRFSCRWHHDRSWLLEARAIAIRAKTAV